MDVSAASTRKRAKTKAPDTSEEAPTFLNQLTEQTGTRINHFPFSLIGFKQTDHEIVPKWARKQSLHQYIAQSNAYIGDILTINIKIYSDCCVLFKFLLNFNALRTIKY